MKRRNTFFFDSELKLFKKNGFQIERQGYEGWMENPNCYYFPTGYKQIVATSPTERRLVHSTGCLHGTTNITSFVLIESPITLDKIGEAERKMIKDINCLQKRSKTIVY